MRFRGVPYKWGGTRPKTGFDCSGLVKYVFARLGVSLPHYAAAQWYSPDSVWVPPYRLQAGDLVFFVGSDGTRKDPGHVGIYVGDGYLIDAPHTGSSVRIDSLDEGWFANNYVGAKRVLGVSSAARHLLNVSTPGPPLTFGTANRRPPTIKPGGEPLRVAASGADVTQTGSRSYWTWGAAVLSPLLLLVVAGSLAIGRGRRGRPDPSA